tara:strand:+ start:289 stop:777 length:489 start_codon:yes stop_codon:yes gene_type:complete
LTVKIGVISDTHVKSLSEIPIKSVKLLSEMDMIIHAGDYSSKQFLDELKKLGNFKGVYGNIDPEDIRSELNSKEIIKINDFSIGIAHPAEGGTPFFLARRIMERFDKIDILIYGHSHTAKKETINGVLCINPGSLTGISPALNRTLAILEIGKRIEANIITL